MSNEIKIESGEKREFITGAKSQASVGKGTPVLVPGDAILDIAKLFEKGAAIYSPRNWEKGIPLSEILNSLERHLQQEKMGQTGENHARALAWRAVIYLATKLRIAEGLLPDSLNDMPDYEFIAGDYNAVEIDGPESELYVPQIDDIVHLHFRMNVEFPHIVPQLQTANYRGRVIEKIHGAANLYGVKFGSTKFNFYTDEMTLLKRED